MTLSRLPYNFEEALAEVKMWRSSHIPAGDIRALKHRIHELEGEVIGYKRLFQEAETASLPVQEPVVWDKPSASFNEWWDSDRRGNANPFETDSFAYWAWEGWQAAQPEQEPAACRFCHSKKGCWAWQCYHCGEIDDVQQPAPLPVQAEYDKTEMNSFVIDLYDLKMREGKHGHYEALFYCVHQAIKRAAQLKILDTPPAAQHKPLTEQRIHKLWRGLAEGEGIEEFARAVEADHGIKEKT
jgi:hypothetical protein